MNEEEKQDVLDRTEHPQEFVCPITLALMIEPVMLFDDGHTYEKTAIQEWILSNDSSPITTETLTLKKFKTNFALKSQICRYKQQLFQETQIEKYSTPAHSRRTTPRSSVSAHSAITYNHSKRTSTHSSSVSAGAGSVLSSTSTTRPLADAEVLLSNNTNTNHNHNHNHSNGNGSLNQYFIPYASPNRGRSANGGSPYISVFSGNNNNDDDELHTVENAFDELSSKNFKISKSTKKGMATHTEPAEEFIEINLQLLGNCNVGKTAFRKFVEFNDYRSSSAPTIGSEFSFVQLAQKHRQHFVIKVRLSDVTGQFDRFHSVSRMQYRDIHGAILVCAIDEKQSISDLKTQWLKDLREYASDSIKAMVICNKCDLMIASAIKHKTTAMSSNNKKTQMYQQNMLIASQFAGENSLPIYNVSCKTGEYVQQAVKDLVDRILSEPEVWKALVIKSMDRMRSQTIQVQTPLGPPRNPKKSCCSASLS